MSIVMIRQALTQIFAPRRVSNVSHAYRQGGRIEVIRFTLSGPTPTTHELEIEGGPLMVKITEKAVALRSQLEGESDGE